MGRDSLCERMSPRCKICIASAACCGVTVAVLVPIGIFVIGPHVAQSVLDNTDIALPNLTQAACPNQYVWLFNHAQIKVPGIGPIKLSTTLESYMQETWTTACVKDGMLQPGAVCGENATEYQMGSYNSPEMKVSVGENHNNFNVTMNSNTSTVLSAWVIPLWVSGQKTRLILKARDIKVKVMGITFSGLTMRNDLTCKGVSGSRSVTVPNSVCYPNDPKHEPIQTQEHMAVCEAGVHSLTPTTTVAPAATTNGKKDAAPTTATVIA